MLNPRMLLTKLALRENGRAMMPVSSSVPSSDQAAPSGLPFVVTLKVERVDGLVSELPEGEFRSGAGRLLFIRRGNRIEMRCPRSKELVILHFGLQPPMPSG